MASELNQSEYDRLKEVLSLLSPEEIKKQFPNPSAIGNRFVRELIESLVPPEDTATNLQSSYGSMMDGVAEAIEGSEEKTTDVFEDARDKRLKIDEDYRRKIEDANRDHAQKMQDIARDVERKQEDAIRDYNQKVEDINRDANEAIAEAHADYRESELEKEEEYQRRLEELRQRFLFNLEDALRERDARQVLRLIREYNFEKKQLEEQRKDEQEDAKRELARKLAEIERERQLKLEAARRELAEKQAEIALWAEREREDAAIALARKLADAREWHKRELQEYQQYLQEKLRALAEAIVKEYQLTAAGAQAIYNLLQGYFGSGGAISQLLANGLSANLGGILNSGEGASSTWNSLADTWSQLHFAEGGSYVATRPTRAIFGEKGPEVATFTPLNRTGANVGKMFGDLESGGSQNSLSLRISLQDGLVAEIVETSLDSVATIIDRVSREK